MNFVILVLFAVGFFALLTFLRQWHDIFFLMAVSIGCGVNSCVFTSYSNPVVLGQIYFGMDSILFMLFAYCLIATLRDYGLPQFKSMASATIVAILISGLIEFFTLASSEGTFSNETLLRYAGFVLSALGSTLGCYLMFLIFKKLQEKKFNLYLTFVLCITVLCCVNYVFVYGGMSLLSPSRFDNFWWHFLGDVIGKAFCLILGCISYYIVHLWWYKSHPVDKNK